MKDDGDTFSESTMRSVVKREEIERFGERSLAGVLSKVPGVTITAQPGRAPEVRLRGLGRGYTRLLVNGEAVPSDFSIDSISAYLIESIEVMRGSRADASSQAIAGTINIVLKSASGTTERTYQVTGLVQGGRPGGSVDGRWSVRDGSLSRHLTASFQRDISDRDWHTLRQVTDLTGTGTEQQMSVGSASSASSTFNLGGGLQRKSDKDLSWRWESSLRYRQIDVSETEYRTGATGAGFGRPSVLTQDNLSTISAQSKGSWDWLLDDDAKVEATLAVAAHRRTLRRAAELKDDSSQPQEARSLSSTARTRTTNSGGKYRAPYIEDHSVIVGLDFEDAWRSEGRNERDVDLLSGSINRSTDDFESSARRVAMFAQDEWSPSKAWSAYVGLRWEGIDTRTTGGSAVVQHFHSILSPSLQAVVKLPGDDVPRQLRLALGRTYKTPNPRDLIPRQWTALENSPLTPDDLGNPSLRPELAWALDVGFEQKSAATTFTSAVFAKHIDDVIVRELFESDGRWIERRVNGGRAVLYGFEADLRLDQKKILTTAPRVEWALYLARNHSRLVDAASGSRRLDQQAPWVARVGWEHRLSKSQWRWGAQVQFEQGSHYSAVSHQTRTARDRTTMDMYAALATTSKQTLRVSVSNALSTPLGEELRFSEGALVVEEHRREQAKPVLRASWRAPF